MKLRRSATPPPSGRQRLRNSDDVAPKPNSFSYRASRSDSAVKTGRQSQRQILKTASKTARSFWLQRFGYIILVIAALASIFNIVTLSTSANILPLTSQTRDTVLQNQAVYQAGADKLLGSSLMNRTKITINSVQLSQRMLAQFPELTSVTVTMPLLARRPIFYIQPAQPAVVLINSTGAYVLDTSGKVLRKAAVIADLKQPLLPVITDQSGLTLTLNQQALPSASIGFITEVIAQLSHKQLTVSSMTLPPAANELDATIAGQAYTVKFNLQNNDARQQAGTFLATIGQLQKQNTTPVKYVDVRVDGRAYYQ